MTLTMKCHLIFTTNLRPHMNLRRAEHNAAYSVFLSPPPPPFPLLCDILFLYSKINMYPSATLTHCTEATACQWRLGEVKWYQVLWFFTKSVRKSFVRMKTIRKKSGVRFLLKWKRSNYARSQGSFFLFFILQCLFRNATALAYENFAPLPAKIPTLTSPIVPQSWLRNSPVQLHWHDGEGEMRYLRGYNFFKCVLAG